MEFHHVPVLYKEVIDGLKIKEDGTYLDGTVGGGNHSLGILEHLKTGRLICLDQDTNALEASRDKLKGFSNVSFYHLNYKDFTRALEEEGVQGLDGILLDLGVSSHQFDQKDRGFSYRFNAALDMRMDQSKSFSAKDIVNTYSLEDLNRIFQDYGEERWSKRIAEFIVEARKKAPIETTFDLVEIIKAAIPKEVRRKGGHPAKRIFQALRIEVNDELNVLKDTLYQMIQSLNPGGRLVVISFHSLEDRIVKEIFKYAFLDCICPPQQPVCTCDKRREIKIITRKPITASPEELEVNPRSSSAKCRIAEKL